MKDKLENTKFYFIQSLGELFLKKCLDSFDSTFSNNKSIEKIIIKELDSRENTLNYILRNHDKNYNLFICVDDIIFTKGWYEKLANNISNGEIIGFSTIYSNNLIQSIGYYFYKQDLNITYRGYLNNQHFSKINKFEYRECDFICGCLMWINSEVLEKVNKFPEGFNRWSEMLFCSKARENNYKVIVLDAFVYHLANSTKNKELKKSSESYFFEKNLWKLIVRNNLTNLELSHEISLCISKELKEVLNNAEKILIYGAGTIAELITTYSDLEKYSVVSSLEEEVSKKINNIYIKSTQNIENYSNHLIINSAIGYEYKLKRIFPSNMLDDIVLLKKEIVGNKEIIFIK